MTLTVCLVGQDGIVIATDSRGTFGDPRGITAQNDTITKIHVLGKVGVAIAGHEQAHLLLEEVLKAIETPVPTPQQAPPAIGAVSTPQTNIQDMGVTQVMEKVREISRRKFDEWYSKFPLVPNPMQSVARPTIQFTIAGYDKEGERHVSKLYTLVSNFDFAPTRHAYGFALGGVVNYALYWLNRLYVPEMKTKKLKNLAAYVITETIAQDGKVGGPVQIATIEPNERPVKLTEVKVRHIIKDNEKINRKLKNIFSSD